MKTSEFIKKMDKLGYEVVVYGYHTRVYRGATIVAEVYNDEVKALNTYWNGYVTDELFELCVEYAKTPIEERKEHKEDKKYCLRLPIKGEPSSSYLNYEENTGDFSFMSKSEAFYWKTQFTQKEIDELPNQDFIKTLIKEEVECQS